MNFQPGPELVLFARFHVLPVRWGNVAFTCIAYRSSAHWRNSVDDKMCEVTSQFHKRPGLNNAFLEPPRIPRSVIEINVGSEEHRGMGHGIFRKRS